MSLDSDVARGDRFDPREGSGLAFAVGFFFSARILIVLVSVRLLGQQARAGAESALGLDMVLLGLACFHSIGARARTFGSMVSLASVRWVLVFLIFSACSLAWSATISLTTSAAYWCGMAADVGIVALLLRTGTVTGVAHALMKGFIWSTCCLALVAWIMPVQADLRLGDEEFFNTNQIGNVCAFAIFLAQYLMRRKDGKWGIPTAFLVITLLRSLSKATIIAFLVGEGFLMIQDRSISRKTRIYLTAALTAIILVSWGLIEAYYDIYTTAGNQAETLTGRTAIWAYALNAGLERPWIGHGFDSMWKVAPLFGSGQFEARHAENEVLQQFYAYGVVGIVMLAGIYGSLFLETRRLQQKPVKMIFYCVMIYTVVRGLAEAEPFDLLLPLWAVVLIAMLVKYGDTTGEQSGVVGDSADYG